MNKISKLNILRLDKNIILKTVNLLEQGKIIIVPAKSFYGISCDALNKDAVNKIYKIKNRSKDKPFIVLVKNQTIIKNLVEEIPKVGFNLIKKFMPGNLTLIFKANKNTPKYLQSKDGKIAIRIPENKISRAILKNLSSKMMVSTSVNLSGLEKGTYDISKLSKEILKKIDKVLDIGKLDGKTYSTIIDLTKNSPIIIREGTISKLEILKYIS